VVFLFNGFLVASVLLRFVFPAVSLEGEPFWSVRSAPVSLKKLYLYKLGGSLLLVLGIAELLAAASTALLRNDPLLIRFASICMGFLAIGLTGLNMGAGAYFASFKEKNPIRVASSQGASLTFLGSMSFLSFSAMLMIVPLKKYFDNLIIRGMVTTQWMYLPILLVGMFSLILFLVSTAMGVRSIRRDY
jgi:ABC-2 type transport system permease protein